MYVCMYIGAMQMFDPYIMYIFTGAKVNRTSSKNARLENRTWRQLVIYIK